MTPPPQMTTRAFFGGVLVIELASPSLVICVNSASPPDSAILVCSCKQCTAAGCGRQIGFTMLATSLPRIECRSFWLWNCVLRNRNMTKKLLRIVTLLVRVVNNILQVAERTGGKGSSTRRQDEHTQQKNNNNLDSCLLDSQ